MARSDQGLANYTVVNLQIVDMSVYICYIISESFSLHLVAQTGGHYIIHVNVTASG